ncbi:restriction endonuclease subunit S [Staphylococcus hominis]|uniref:restriction endonuclease subunit S n=1 Tax=Staphylococcus hominis TaxID=1290 RepID=UPI0034CDFF4F
MNKQTNTPELRFPEFDEEWEKRKLGEVVNYKNGGSFESLVKNHGVYKLITLKSVNTEGKLCNSGKYIDDKCVETLCNDTLVMILSEQAPGLVGMTAIIPNNNEYVLNQRVAALVPKQFIDSQFLSKLINRNQKYFSVRSAGTKVKNISKGHVENFNFLSPDYTEQQKIGNFFSKLDRQIELEEEKLELLEQQKRGYMQKIFSQELRFKDKNGNQYPEWVTKKLGDIGKVAMNKRIYKNETTENGEIPFYKIGNFGKNADTFITREKFDEYKEKYPYPNVGDILISASGSIGRTIEYTGEDAYYQDSNIVWLNHNDEVINKYLKYFYKIVKWSGIEGTTIKRLYNKNILNTKIELPTVEEQYKMANFLSKLDKIIDIQIEKIELLKQRKKGLLQKMFV